MRGGLKHDEPRMARSSRRSLALSGRIPGDPPYVDSGSHPAERLLGLGVRSWRTLVMPYFSSLVDQPCHRQEQKHAHGEFGRMHERKYCTCG
jgi:hypothetical protein